jgi:HK97 family phage major capsid protein
LGQLEIKAEELRHVVCVTSDLLQDASFPVENWIMNKVSDGFRNLISASIAVGDGVGKPMPFRFGADEFAYRIVFDLPDSCAQKGGATTIGPQTISIVAPGVPCILGH